MNEPAKPRKTFRAAPLAVLLPLAIAAAAGTAVLYGKASASKNEAASCAGARAAAARLAPLAHGDVAALAVDKNPRPAPDISFKGPDGADVKLADFRGRNVLLNLWATWCVPCRAEMPSLDRLEAKLGGARFQVVTVNIDTTRLDRPKAFFTDHAIKNLKLYADPTADAFETLKVAGKALGLPTSLLIGADGCEIGVMAGPAPWDSKDGTDLITAMLSRTDS